MLFVYVFAAVGLAVTGFCLAVAFSVIITDIGKNDPGPR